jgi:hypothetical protein
MADLILVLHSLEDSMQSFLEQFKLTISSFQVLPNVLNSPAFFMRNGYCK